jgi:hypothetical protein
MEEMQMPNSSATMEYDAVAEFEERWHWATGARRGGGEETAASSAATLRDEPSARTLRWFPTPDSARTLPGWSAATLGVLEMVAEPRDELAGCALAEVLLRESVAALDGVPGVL